MPPAKKPLNPRLTALRFLEKCGFFAYQNYHLYLPKLSLEIKSALSSKNPFNLALDTDWPALQDTPSIYSIELGGTFLKLYQSQIKKGQVTILRQEKIAFYKNINYTPTKLFTDLQKALDKFIPKSARADLSELYFIFAFPLHPIHRNNSAIDGQIKYFGKTRRSRGILGLPLGQKLEKHLRAQGYPLITISVINDGLANLMAAAQASTAKISSKLPPASSTNLSPESSINLPLETSSLLLNLIAGTGTNICAAYRLKNQLHLDNLEFGDFHCFPAATFDARLKSRIPGGSRRAANIVAAAAPLRARYLAEKMFAGTWQNLLLQIIARQLLKEKILTALPHPQLLSWSSADLEKYFASPTPKSPARQRSFTVLQIIWQELSKRGAFICAITLSQIIQTFTTQKIPAAPVELPPIQILLSGAILEHSPTFRQNLKKFLKIPRTQFLLLEHTTPLATAMLRQLQKSL